MAGKGGVGKTTVSAALARVASMAGLSVVVVEVESKSGLSALFGSDELLGHDERVLLAGDDAAEGPEGEVRGRAIRAEAALTEYLEAHGLGRLSRRLGRTGVLDVAATAVPGIKDVLVLGKVKQMAKGREADLVIVDAPASGHALTFLASAGGLVDLAQAGPLRAQAQEVQEMLADPTRCQVLLVTTPEETPVNEVVETAFALEDRVGVALAPVVVNGLYPVLDGLEADPVPAASAQGVTLRAGEAEALAAAAAFRRHRQGIQREQVARLSGALPLPQLPLPTLFSVDLGPADVEHLAAALAGGIRALPDTAQAVEEAS